jgi:hypothetical protein
MNQVSERADPVPVYRRGIASITAIRGVIRRFLPACTATISAFAAFPIIAEPARAPIVLSLVTLQIASLTVGYGLGLEVLRRWLYPDAGIDGRRSFICGLASPLALGVASIFLQGTTNLVKIAAVAALAGAGMAAIMFLAWLRPTPNLEHHVVLGLTQSRPDQLPGT